MKQTLRYRNKTIVVDVDYPIRVGVCEACNRDTQNGVINVTQLHHWRYAYKLGTVRKNPKLALEHTVELCFPDHRVGDVFVELCRLNPKYLLRVIDVAPDYIRDDVRERVIALYDYFYPNNKVISMK